MINLPQVTLVVMTSIDFEEHTKAIEYSCRGINFGEIKFISELKIPSLDEYSKAMVYNLKDFVNTEYCLTIQADGFVVNPEMWNPEWLNYDYIGAPWPIPPNDFTYRTPDGELVRVGNGGFTLRSKKILNMPYDLELAWRPYYGYYNEDGFLCCHNRRILQHYGVKFAPIEVAKHFSREHEVEENQDVEKPFGFHKYNGRNRQYGELLETIY